MGAEGKNSQQMGKAYLQVCGREQIYAQHQAEQLRGLGVQAMRDASRSLCQQPACCICPPLRWLDRMLCTLITQATCVLLQAARAAIRMARGGPASTMRTPVLSCRLVAWRNR